MSDANERLRQKAQNEQTCIALNALLNTKDAALAAKDARIAELSEMLATVLENVSEWREDCAVEAMMVLANAKSAKTRSAQPSPAPVTATHSEPCNCPGNGKPEPEKHAPNCPVRKPATHSEDGREAPEVVAWLTSDKRHLIFEGVLDRSQLVGCQPLMTVAQHERIVAAKEAEIAEWREQRNDLIEGNNLLHAEIAELRAQPARQVGGGDRSAKAILEVVARYAPGVGLPAPLHQAALDANDWLKSGAALAPAAVVVDLSDDEIVEIMRPELNPADGGYVCDTGSEELVKGIRLVIARLNRRAIPVGLLERVSKLFPEDMSDDGTGRAGWIPHVRDTVNELRALLGKE